MKMNKELTLPEIKTGLPSPKLFLVGIGGIGMSGLAQLLNHAGYSVAGSDRALNATENADLYDSLRADGIKLYPQDGSGVTDFAPDMLIASTAVESGNPDFKEGIPVMHRAMALAQALDLYRPGAKLIAVAGSCGKTSTTGWIADALLQLEENVLMVNGGYNVRPGKKGAPGNFTCSEGTPSWLVAEVDESDKSLINFAPDYAVLLNVGNDHYEEDELRRVFTTFLSRAKCGIVVQDALSDLVPEQSSCKVACFGEKPRENCIAPINYESDRNGISFNTDRFGIVAAMQYGRHSAQNACAVLALLDMLGLGKTAEELAGSVKTYPGIRQRFEVMGETESGIPAINDYAHNPEKINAAISTARERYGSPIIAVFQPHGFTPFGFMRMALKEVLKNTLNCDDRFILLPVYYAGGTAAFSPTSEEVAAELAAEGINAMAADRNEAAAIIKNSNAKAIIVMGARDRSLRVWTGQLCTKDN